MVNELLKKQLEKMAKIDQQMRKEDKYDKNVDLENTKKFKAILKEYGWPSISLVGKEGAEAAWLIVQHSDFDVDFQKKCLKFLKNAVKNNEAEKQYIAYLTDRILVNSGKKQIYGTQFFMDSDGIFKPRPIKNKNQIDQIRKEYNLSPLEEYKNIIFKLNKQKISK